MKTVRRFLVAIVVVVTGAYSAQAETPLGSTISEEVFLYMKVRPGAAQALLPEGWTLAPWAKGAWAGANLLIILGETRSDLDPKGKPRRDTAYMSIRLFTWGRSDEVEWRIFNTHRFATDALAPSSAARDTVAEFRRSASRAGDGQNHAEVEDHWEMSQDGGTFRFEVSYTAQTPRFSTQQGKVANPDDIEGPPVGFRIEQLSYMILGLDKPEYVHDLKLTNTVPALASLLDGSEEVLSVRVLPVKLTNRFLP